MRIEYIQSFQIDKNVTFTGAMVAIEGTKAFMIQKCGYMSFLWLLWWEKNDCI